VDVEEFDLEAAVKLRTWVEARTAARKRVSSLLRAFDYERLTASARERMDEALRLAGVEARPSLSNCARTDWVQFAVVGRPLLSESPPNQIMTWHEHNWTGSGDAGHFGQWLRCLSSTEAGDRQLVWSGSQVAGVVTFAGWLRHGPGFYEGWGSVARLPKPVSRERLLADPRTRRRFDERGIHGLQGLPIKLGGTLSSAIGNLASGLSASKIPLDEPDYDEEHILWAGLHGLTPEAHIEAAVASKRRLWKRLGFPEAPARQRVLGQAGRVDLIAGDVVGEAKRAVTLRDGPGQIERYLRHLVEVEGRRPSKLRGVLLQCAGSASNAVLERIEQSEFRIELWTVEDRNGWRLERLA
jgi:hypothetical protein